MNELRCEIKRSLWWMVVLCIVSIGFFGFVAFSAPDTLPDGRPDPLPRLMFAPIIACYVLGGIFFALYIVRSCILADENGLRWRDFKGWHEANWQNIAYYSRLGSTQNVLYLQTPRGEIQISSYYANTKALRALVESHAREIEPPPSRLHSIRWPLVYHYRTWENRFAVLAPLYLWGFAVYGVFFAKSEAKTSVSFAQTLREIAQISWILAALLVVFLIALLSSGVFVLGIMPVQSWLNARRHKNERIEATTEALKWTNGAQIIEIRWDELEELRTFYRGKPIKMPCYRASGNGKSLEWTSDLKGESSLRYYPLPSLARTYAPNARFVDEAAERRNAREQNAENRSGENGIFHFRTHDARFVLWSASIIALILPIPVYFAGAWETEHPPSPVAYWISAAILLAVLFGWICYFQNSIRLSENGLEQRYFWSHKFISWPEIRRYGHGTFDFVESATTKIRFPRAFLGNSEQLRETIRERAVNSENKAWDEQSKPLPVWLEFRATKGRASLGKRGLWLVLCFGFAKGQPGIGTALNI